MSIRTPHHWPEHGVPLYFFDSHTRPLRKNTTFLKPKIAAIRSQWEHMDLETLSSRVRAMTDWLHPNDRRRSTQVFATFIAAETIRRDGRQRKQSRRYDPSYRTASSHPSTPKKQSPTQDIDAPDSPSRDSPVARRPNTRIFTPEATPPPAVATTASMPTSDKPPAPSQLGSARTTMSPAMAAKISQFERVTRVMLRELRRSLLEEENYTEAEAEGLLRGVVDGLVDLSDAEEVVEG
ncbi:uncharacterized protein MYCFIDRAFT_78967 [Pseudocercospora fijiensis CIRAD86]|uniref:Uncharacterized protein n=1 Tax=Pseudocercospora fijiensis (strain CIRAD86) TaxID=383855 RepID=M3AAD8_PSEFD|nr:uncharacterized protein MYCFIDRAFT_78967 [Pseudocercospora fijiensis CIRAD86]EME81571.1 hypothetical protein MYCFIDRAFT_78967 [Pseudocercospora fijiensis CIRAD86]